jgi:hypothetical protein
MIIKVGVSLINTAAVTALNGKCISSFKKRNYYAIFECKNK